MGVFFVCLVFLLLLVLFICLFVLRVAVCPVSLGERWDGRRAHREEPGRCCLQRRVSVGWFSSHSQTSRNGKLVTCCYTSQSFQTEINLSLHSNEMFLFSTLAGWSAWETLREAGLCNRVLSRRLSPCASDLWQVRGRKRCALNQRLSVCCCRSV